MEQTIRIRNTPFMQKLLHKGAQLIKKHKHHIVDGYSLFLFDTKTKTGWRYQVEYIHDTRFYNDPYVVVFAYPPKMPWHPTYWLKSFD